MQRGRGRGNQNQNQSVNASLVASGPGAPAPQPQVQVDCPSARASKAGKLTVPHYGQCSLLGARSERLERHDSRARAEWSIMLMHRRRKRAKI